ncbi:MAG: hypothetical protein WBA20_10485 [Ketobacter sp.]|uniref:hypothetical protein n=1 Tax=Ketobacter sp. MCCC 1A13808 TaxID=2602738 RepID=UPI0012EB6F68|nr:hypothetical protein [Ketobacter sp. MCCC 1A13808]
MGYVFVISGVLIALNIGFGYVVSEKVGDEPPVEGVVEVQDIPAEQTPTVQNDRLQNTK